MLDARGTVAAWGGAAGLMVDAGFFTKAAAAFFAARRLVALLRRSNAMGVRARRYGHLRD